MFESAYAGALQFELQQLGIPAKREMLLNVHYKSHVVGVYRADFVIDGGLILELKALPKAGRREKQQLLHYLRLTGLRLGLVLNFGTVPEVMRVVNNWTG